MFKVFKKNKNTSPKSQPLPKSKLSFGPPEVLPQDIDYDPKEDLIGSGCFGSVYKARCRGLEVAVKTPLKQNLSDEQMKSFKHEVEMMSQIYHPNVVMLMGACMEKGKLQIVTERCKTNLEDLLISSIPLSLYERVRMAKDAALGMDWLHGVTKLVHRDLKPANLLVDYNHRVKIADFGFCQFKKDISMKDTPKGTPIWMAPEVILREPYNEKVDVYSFGIVLWEIVTRKKPFTHYTDHHSFFTAICFNHERPPIPRDVPEALQQLMASCWKHKASERCSFDEIVISLSEIMVDCVIEFKSAADFWKKHFLQPTQNLIEKVEWLDFRMSLIKETKANPNDDIYMHLQQLLVTRESDLGEEKEYVTMERFDKIVKYFGSFFEASHGAIAIKEINRLMEQSWFHGDITYQMANSRLARQAEGTFLVRLSSADPKKTPFTISTVGDAHMRIKRIPGGFEYQERLFSSIYEIVDTDKNLNKACPKAYIAYS